MILYVEGTRLSLGDSAMVNRRICIEKCPDLILHITLNDFVLHH